MRGWRVRVAVLLAGWGWVLAWAGAGALALRAASATAPEETGRSAADRALGAYFEAETAALAARSAAVTADPREWMAGREERRRELLDMLGLWPMPERTPLQPTVTGRIEQDDLTVEKLHFQSLPGLYVTANLYLPKGRTGRRPAVLYVCGHAQVKTNGISCGNKVGYQHHGIWLARHGYVCLLIDTLQLGEIEGVHHGTHRLGQWWWNSRGYSPAGVEAWNGIRAIDYLQSRPEVDPERIGMTGRSGGGSYTWTTAAVDERVRVAAPVAGITDLRNQVVDGVVEGHCDCMFFVNTHRWDFGTQCALLAPRPLLIVNTDSDPIFPLSGVQRLHASTRRLYEGLGVGTNLGLVIAPGPHRDTQDLQVPVLRWLNRHLLGEDPPVEDAALPRFRPLDLRVFDTLPSDERNTRAAEWFGPAAAPAVDPADAPPAAWSVRLQERVFAGWPAGTADLPAVVESVRGRPPGRAWRGRTWTFESQPHVPLPLELVTRGNRLPDRWTLRVADAPDGPSDAGVVDRDEGRAWFAPRGTGPGAWTGDARRQVQIRRRFMLLGQTLDGMRVWDLRQAIRLLAGREARGRERRITVEAEGPMAVHAVFAAWFEPSVAALRLSRLPAGMRDGPDYLNVLTVTDLPGVLDRLRARGVEITVGPD